MPGAPTQLMMIGGQDQILTDNPNMTFFEAVHRPYVNFAIESMNNAFSANADFNRTGSVLLQRNGDLITRCVLEVTLPQVTVSSAAAPSTTTSQVGFSWAEFLGQSMINYYTFRIGPNDVNREYGMCANVWCMLNLSRSQFEAHLKLIGQALPSYNVSTGADNSVLAPNTSFGMVWYISGLQTYSELRAQSKIYVPLKTFFYDAAVALPSVALPFAEARLDITFRQYTDLYFLKGSNAVSASASSYLNKSIVDAQLWVDTVFVDNFERNRIASEAHELLIRQNATNNDQTVSANTTSLTTNMNFNHPVTAVLWFVQLDSTVSSDTTSGVRAYATFTNATGGNPTSAARISFSGGDRYASRDGVVHSTLAQYQNCSSAASTTDSYLGSEGLNMYSFSLFLEDWQPAGSMNFSRVDNAQLIQTLTGVTSAAKIYIWAQNLNTLRVGNGTAGLGYSA